MDKKITNRLLGAILLFGMGAIIYIFFGFSEHTVLKTAQVSRTDVVEGVSLNGTVKAAKEADLGFRNATPATVTKLYTKTGDVVKAGTIIAQVENADFQAQYDQASASVTAAQLHLDELYASVKMEKLKVKGLTSNAKKVQQAQVTVTEKSVAVQQAALLGAQAGLKNAQAQLAKTVLKAPFDGTIAKQTITVGDVVMPGAPAITLVADKDIFETDVFASEQDVAKMHSGDVADVTLDAFGSATVFHAAITTIDTAATIHNGTPVYKVTLVFKEHDARITSGMNANILLTTNAKKNVVAIPETAILNRDGKQFVLISENGVQSERAIQTGIRGMNGMTEVVEGLQGDETIIQ